MARFRLNMSRLKFRMTCLPLIMEHSQDEMTRFKSKMRDSQGAKACF